jgi:hypothetical protein
MCVCVYVCVCLWQSVSLCYLSLLVCESVPSVVSRVMWKKTKCLAYCFFVFSFEETLEFLYKSGVNV